MLASLLLPLLFQILGAAAAPPRISRPELSLLMDNVKTNITGPLTLISIPSSISNSATLHADPDTEEHPDDNYPVPGTNILLSIGYFNSPTNDLNHTRLGSYLREMHLQLEAKIRDLHSHGLTENIPLRSHNEDPFRREGVGFYFIAKSSPGMRMTYRMLLDVLEGLFDVMYIAEKPWGCYASIAVKDVGRVGTAVVLPKKPALDGVSSA